MEYIFVVCNVYEYSDSNKPFMQVSVNEALSACNHLTSETFILVLSHALYFSEYQEPDLLRPYVHK